MRVPRYISPSALTLFYKDRNEYYIRYLADVKPPNFPQTLPMAAGSAFDAYIKSYLYRSLTGHFGPLIDFAIPEEDGTITKHTAPAYTSDLLFSQQVEAHIRTEAKPLGIRAFGQYLKSGAPALLLMDMHKSITPPRFEFTVEKQVVCEKTKAGVNFLGKPDLQFKVVNEREIIHDFKLNGYCGNYMTSPKPGYIRCLDGWSDGEMDHTRSHGTSHKDCHLQEVHGVIINVATYLENIDRDWANQLAIYSWLMGAEVGSDFIVGIEQLCGMPVGGEMFMRVATHRCRISETYQHELFGRAAYMWRIINGPPEGIFEDQGMGRKESKEQCTKLDTFHEAFKNETEEDKFISSIIR